MSLLGLSYMSQMGGWAVLDYALYFAADPVSYMHLGYASCLSSRALLNSGVPESNYGYWYPGQNNDGGASGGFEPRPWGRAWLGNKIMGRGPWWYSGEIDLGFGGYLRSAATVVVDDPIFGLMAYGGDLKRDKHGLAVIPKDGLRARLHILQGDRRIHLLLDRDGFAVGQPIRFDTALREMAFTLENRSGNAHETGFHVSGMPAGVYGVRIAGHEIARITSHSGEEHEARIPIGPEGAHVTLTRLPHHGDGS